MSTPGRRLVRHILGAQVRVAAERGPTEKQPDGRAEDERSHLHSASSVCGASGSCSTATQAEHQGAVNLSNFMLPSPMNTCAKGGCVVTCSCCASCEPCGRAASAGE